MFMSPVFYPISALPPEFQDILLMNPLTASIEMLRDVIYWGRIPDVQTYVVNLGLGIVSAWLGFAWFQKTRKGFADVL
jgi:lipopolysaccharide transport system permease protein